MLAVYATMVGIATTTIGLMSLPALFFPWRKKAVLLQPFLAQPAGALLTPSSLLEPKFFFGLYRRYGADCRYFPGVRFLLFG